MSTDAYIMGRCFEKSASIADFVDNYQFEKLADAVNEKLVGKIVESKGFVFLDIPNSILDAFLPLIDDPKAIKPPEKPDNKIGAHITVIKRSETKKLDRIKGLGRSCRFSVTGIRSFNPEGWDDMDKCWVIECKSKDLENLRKDNGLSPLVDGDHEFHITLATRKRGA